MKKLYYSFACILLSIILSACSTMQTYSNFKDAKAIIENQSYQLRVRTGNEIMDKIVYEFACNEFSGCLPVVEKEPYTGTIDVVFSSSSESAFLGSIAAYSTTTGYVNGWYTGSNYAMATVNSATSSGGVVSGGQFTWQNSTMLVSIKDVSGKKLWSADYKYKGGWELSGWVVNTPHEVARYCIKKITDKIREDFTSLEN